MLTLLSPAKSLDFTPALAGLDASEPRFQYDTSVLLKRCKKLSVRSLRNLMDLSQPLAELNHRRYQDISFSFTEQNSKPAVLAFTGDVYRHLDAASLGKRDLRWAQQRIRILSGLYGLLRPLDLIQPYRLEMGSRLRNTRGKNLYDFWGNRLVDSLNEEHSERPVSAILNLASNEYFKAIPAKRLEAPLVTAVFQEIRDGKPRTISFLAKRARGMMTRYVVKNRIDDPEGLKGFNDAGYGYSDDLSSDDRLVFVREQA
jgi:cytoplasmic iron level regulating protein YaaA (DUF328/UPF0246 family)